MEQAHSEGLVSYPRTLPPLLSGSPPSLAFAPHDMTWRSRQDNPHVAVVPPPSSAVVAEPPYDMPYSSLTSHRPAERTYDDEASPSFVRARFQQPPYDRPSESSEMDAGFRQPESSLRSHRAVRQGRPADGYVHHYEMSSREASPDRLQHAFPAPDASSMPHPESASPTYRSKRYAPYPPQDHIHASSSSASGSDLRSNSPARSDVTSHSHTSVTAVSVQPHTRDTPTVEASSGRKKGTKTRLWTVDRKKICLFAEANPHLRQEDIAKEFKVERSTVSKILKRKEQWFHAPDEPGVKVAKWRLPKWPRIEMLMQDWVLEEHRKGTIFSDSMIHKKALEFAADYPYIIGIEKFKASPGWVENFKARQGIKKGQYLGDGLAKKIALATGIDFEPSPEFLARMRREQGFDTESSVDPNDRDDDLDIDTTLPPLPPPPPPESLPDGQARYPDAWQHMPPPDSIPHTMPPPVDPQLAVTGGFSHMPDPQHSIAVEPMPYAGPQGEAEAQDPYAQRPSTPYGFRRRENVRDAILDVQKFVREDAGFKAHFQLEGKDEDVLTVLVRAIKTYYDGQPFNRPLSMP